MPEHPMKLAFLDLLEEIWSGKVRGDKQEVIDAFEQALEEAHNEGVGDGRGF